MDGRHARARVSMNGRERFEVPHRIRGRAMENEFNACTRCSCSVMGSRSLCDDCLRVVVDVMFGREPVTVFTEMLWWQVGVTVGAACGFLALAIELLRAAQ